MILLIQLLLGGRVKQATYPTTLTGWCDYWKWMDKRYDTSNRSPLHHDNRCILHMKRPVVEQSLDRYDS